MASFDNVDPGTSSIANNFFALDQGVVDATLGEIGVSAFDHLSLPANFILGTPPPYFIHVSQNELLVS